VAFPIIMQGESEPEAGNLNSADLVAVFCPQVAK
jgi:hypothetical protein